MGHRRVSPHLHHHLQAGYKNIDQTECSSGPFIVQNLVYDTKSSRNGAAAIHSTKGLDQLYSLTRTKELPPLPQNSHQKGPWPISAMVHRDGVDILMADHSDDQKCSGKLQTNRRQHSPASVRIDTSLSILSPHSVMPVPPKSSISLSPACDLRHHPHCYHHQIEGQLQQEQHPQQPIYSLQDSLHPAHRSSSCEQSAPSITRSSLVVTPVADQEGFDGNKDATHPSNVGGDVEEVLSAERDAIAVSVARRLGGNNSGGPQCLIQQRDHLQCSTASCPASHSCRYSRPGVRDGGNKIGLEDSDGLGVTDSEILVRQLVVMESPLSPLTVMLPAPAPSRTTTHLSSASINTPTRLTHRLSYLTQLDAEETEDNEMVEAPGLEDISNKKELSSSSFPEFDPTDQKTSSTKQPSSAPAPQPSTNSGSLWISPQPALDNSQASSQPQHKQAGPNEEDVPVEDNKPCSGRSNKSYGSLSSRGSNSSPAFPSLYKRLLRIFKPPSDTLDEDNLNIQQDFPQTCQPSSNVVLPKVTPQKPPHTLGFRAKFMRRLKSSPMISSQAVNPITGDTTQHPMDQSVGCEVNEPLLSDYEHEQSCPAGQRIQRRRNRGSRRRAATMPRLPPPSPTLQSKYGVPSKELGAGTQAQVMLLRVRSANRTRLSHPLTSRAVDAGKAHPIGTASNCLSPTSPGLPPSPARRSLSPEDAVETFLRPRSRSGTLMTTTDDAVTPEQREAYRKRLLRRSSTGALSISENGGLIYAIKKFRPPRANETHRQYLKKVCAEFCISTSMDHENIIRTIDLVRDQPGQEIVDEPSVALKTHHSSAKLKSQSQSKNSYGSSEGNEYCSTFEDDNTGEDDFEFKDDGRDCSCLRQSSRYLRGVKSAGDIRPVAYSHGRPIESYSSSTKKRTAARKPIAAKQGRRRSTDMAPAYRKHSESSPLGSALVDYDHSRGSSPILPATDTTSRNSTVAAEVRRKLQQQEHELRQRELARLKELQYEHQQQQKMRERQQQQQQQQKQQQQQQQQSRLLSLFRNENVFPEYCMVMEFAAGGDLFNLLTKAYPPISLQEKHCLWRQLLNGVQFMHSTGVAHRDLKPENLLLDATGRILKITDFGIANVFRSVGDPAPLPCRGIIGSEPYIAPEEFYQAEYDPRAVDVWACGIIFYVMYYSAMPWARADRKKDARFARFWNDITSHRMSEAARRLHYERRQLYFGQQSRDSGSSGVARRGHEHSYRAIDTGSSSRMYNLPQNPLYNHQRAPYVPESMTSSEGSASMLSCGHDGTGSDFESPQTSVEEVHDSSPRKPASSRPKDSSMSSPSAVSVVSGAMTLFSAYNTYAYNDHIGGHEFIDRIELPGCRRVLYAILEPDSQKRLTIDQIIGDEWVASICHCTDVLAKQGLQAAMVHGPGASASKYMLTASGQVHHSHFKPKHVGV